MEIDYKHTCTLTEVINLHFYENHIHLPHLRLTTVQKGAYYSGIKVYNDLPSSIKSLIYDQRKFKTTLKNFLLSHSFYSLEEYFSTNLK
jgi:hypothetical protein